MTNRPKFKQSAETVSVLSILTNAAIGQTITYEQMRKAIKTPIELPMIQQAARSAIRILQRERSMVFACVPNEGYRRLSDEEIVDSSDHDIRCLRNKAKRSMVKLQTANPENLTPEKQGKQSARMAMLAVNVGALDFTRTKKLTQSTDTTASQSVGQLVRRA